LPLVFEQGRRCGWCLEERAESRYLEEIQRHADAAQDELLVGLDPAERHQLNELLAKLLSSHRG
jgi:DNA-binding MarR family transcriptional regulator